MSEILAPPPHESPIDRGIFKDIKDVWDLWNIRGMLILSLYLQTILILFAPLRRRTSRTLVAVLVWLSYLLADWSANYAVAQITKNQGKELKDKDPPKNKKLMALWAPFLLLHLGGPDTITALALEDNALWQRHLFALVFQAVAGAYAVALSMPNPLLPPIILLFVTGFIRYGERTLALYKASLDKFRDSMMKSPDPGPNYAKLMEEFAAKKDSRLPTKIVLIEEPDKHQRPPKLVKPKRDLTHLEIVQYAFRFFDTFKGLVVNIIFSFRERDETRDFFVKLKAEEALRIIEVELGLLYEALFTKAPVLHSWVAMAFRVIALGSYVSAFCVFLRRPRKDVEFHGIDVVITYSLFLVGIALDAVSIYMFLFSDWTFAILSKLKDDPGEKPSLKDCTLNNVLGLRRPRWKKQICCNGVEHEVLTTPFLLRRWSGNMQAFNFIAYCTKTRVHKIHEVMGILRRFCCEVVLPLFHITSGIIRRLFRSILDGINGVHRSLSRGVDRWSRKNQFFYYILYPLRVYVEFWFQNPHFFSHLCDRLIRSMNIGDLLDSMRFVYSETLTKNQWEFIFEELKCKSDFADTPENAKRVSSAKGEWTLRDTRSDKADHEIPNQDEERWNADREKLMRYVADVDYDQSLLLWHIATELCYQSEDESTEENCDYREFSKVMSDYMMYLLIMQPKLMSEVAGIGKIRFRDTLAEANKLLERRHMEDSRDAKRACETILSISTDVEPMNVKGDRSKSVLFDASSLAKKLKQLEEKHGVEKWKIVSRVWVELLSYAACRCEATAHVKQLSRGGELINFVWLLMAHFGLGDQFQINRGDARAKLVVGK